MVPVHAVDNVFRQRKSTCLVVCGNKMVLTLRSINCHIAHVKLLCFSSKATRLSSLDALNHTIYENPIFYHSTFFHNVICTLTPANSKFPLTHSSQQVPKLSSAFHKPSDASKETYKHSQTEYTITSFLMFSC